MAWASEAFGAASRQTQTAALLGKRILGGKAELDKSEVGVTQMLKEERKKQLDIDLLIIASISFVVLVIYIIFGKEINQIVYNTSTNIVLRVLFVGGVFQFGLAGLGITIVSMIRKERLFDYGLRSQNILAAILLSALCCVPDFIYNYFTGNMHSWFPFSDVNTTAEVLKSVFPYNVLGLIITIICWGFFEGYNYVVICDKISERFPSQIKLWDWGAFICAIMCILIHGLIGITPNAIAEMLCTMFLIYGMLMVRKLTGNAWGCVLIFLIYWNAL